MKNQIEALKLAMEINEQTLPSIFQKLKENPLDSRNLEVRTKSLGMLDEWINEAEKVHGNQEVANYGKRQYNQYAPDPKYVIGTTPLTNKGLERVVLVVDDQYGSSDDPMIPSRYGNGKVPGYRFELEDACAGKREQDYFGTPRMMSYYESQKVVDRVRSVNPFVVLLDMNFGFQPNYGLEIMALLNKELPKVPVIIHSSSENEEGKIKINECIQKYGARESIEKLPSPSKMKEILDKYAETTK